MKLKDTIRTLATFGLAFAVSAIVSNRFAAQSVEGVHKSTESVSNNAIASKDTLATVVGRCTKTTISKIGTRLTQGVNGPNVPGSGSAIYYSDGGYQVSYETIAGIEKSRVGDKIILCLVSIPTSCPRGDDRGKWYKATNLRTGETWRLPNSEHDCGGA
jgi:hypothetical protein